MRNGLYYLDSSAYLCVLLGEEHSQNIARELNEARVVSSVLLFLEVERNLIHMGRSGLLRPSQVNACFVRMQEDAEHILVRDLTMDLCASRRMPALATPRSLDLVHLRTALWFQAEELLTAFVTTDVKQRRAAQELSLPTWQP